MGWLLSLIPAPYRLLAGAAGLVALALALAAVAAGIHEAGFYSGYAKGMVEAGKVQAALDKERAAWAVERAAAEAAARVATDAARAEESRRVAALQEALNAAELSAQRERADRVVADAAAGRLRERVQALVTAARFAARNSVPATGGPSAGDATGVLADVLSRCSARVQFLADLADERGRAGQLCERAYDALTPATAASAPAPAATE